MADSEDPVFAARYAAAKKLGEVLRTMGAISPDPKREVIAVGAGADALYVYLNSGDQEMKQKITEIANKEVPGHALKFVAHGAIRPL